jgi:uncharacterized protein
MSCESTQQTPAPSGLSSLRRWLLAAVGVVFVGVAALGVVVPGLPTTLFLIMATWCFTRSCPWLERKLIQVPLFRPFLPYLQPGAPLSKRSQLIALTAMWTAITVSITTLAATGTAGTWTLVLIFAAGVAGTVAVNRKGRVSHPPEDMGSNRTSMVDQD